MIDGETSAEVNFDWDQAQKELLIEAGIDMAKEMESKLLAVAEEVNTNFIWGGPLIYYHSFDWMM